MKKDTSNSVWSKEVPPAKDVDAFIKSCPKQAQAKMRQLRGIIKAALPKAEESISYRMPVYKLSGKLVVAFAGYKKHIGFYPMNATLLVTFQKELSAYESSKGTLRLPLDKPLPVELIKKLIKARIHASKVSE